MKGFPETRYEAEAQGSSVRNSLFAWSPALNETIVYKNVEEGEIL